jgi:hypothetical protein
VEAETLGGIVARRTTIKNQHQDFFQKSSDFVQKVPPIYNFGVLRRYRLALASLGLGICDDFIRILEVQKQFLPAQTEVRFAEGKHKFEKFINQSFLFRQRRKKKR